MKNIYINLCFLQGKLLITSSTRLIRGHAIQVPRSQSEPVSLISFWRNKGLLLNVYHSNCNQCFIIFKHFSHILYHLDWGLANFFRKGTDS